MCNDFGLKIIRKSWRFTRELEDLMFLLTSVCVASCIPKHTSNPWMAPFTVTLYGVHYFINNNLCFCVKPYQFTWCAMDAMWRACIWWRILLSVFCWWHLVSMVVCFGRVASCFEFYLNVFSVYKYFRMLMVCYMQTRVIGVTPQQWIWDPIHDYIPNYFPLKLF